MNEHFCDNNYHLVNVWTIAEKKTFYDKMKNKQKMFVFCTFFYKISYDSYELHKKFPTIHILRIKNMLRVF